MSTLEYLRRDDYVYRHVADEHLLVALRRDRLAPLFMLTVTGAHLWERLAQWSSREALVQALVARFDVDGDTAAADVTDFLAQLQELKALDLREVPE